MKSKLVLMLATVMLMGVTVFAGCKVVGILSEYYAGESSYEQMEQYIVQPSAKPEPTKRPQQEAVEAQPERSESMQVQPEPDDTAFPVVDFAALAGVNEDVVAWITIEGTKVNYPVVQGEDNQYYLKRMIDGERNSAGSIFMDCANASDFTDDNTVLYGHNMNNGSMFAGIRKYRDQEFYEAHPQIMVMTPDGNYMYDIVAGYVASEKEAAWMLDFSTEEKAMRWIGEAMERSGFDSTVQPQPGDRFLTLSTCTYEVENARFVVVAVQRTTTE